MSSFARYIISQIFIIEDLIYCIFKNITELVHEKPPLPNEDEPEQKRARLDDSNLTDKPTENNQVEDEVSYI